MLVQSRGLRDKYCIVGVGETEYSRASARTTRAMAVEAIRKAILDAGLTAADVDGMLDYQGGDSTLANSVASDLGIRFNFYMDVMGGGSSTEALAGLAMGAIEAGMCNTVAIYRSMNGYSEFRIGGTGARAAQPVRGLDLAQVPYGMRSAGQNFAPTFMRHMYEYGTTAAQVAHVRVAHSKHASQNPKALLKQRVTVQDVLHRHALLQERLRVLRGVLAVGDPHVGDLCGGRPVLVHVPHEGRREVLAGAAHAVGHLGQVEPPYRLGGARAGAANAEFRVAVHRAVDRDGIAHARLDRAHGQARERLRRRAAAHHVHVEVEADAQVGGDAVGERRVTALVVEHAIDVGRGEPGVEDRLADRLDGHGARRTRRGARVLRFTDADDAVLVPKPATLDEHRLDASSLIRGTAPTRPRFGGREMLPLLPPTVSWRGPEGSDHPVAGDYPMGSRPGSLCSRARRSVTSSTARVMMASSSASSFDERSISARSRSFSSLTARASCSSRSWLSRAPRTACTPRCIASTHCRASLTGAADPS